MKLWLIIGLLSYLSYSISTSIDKYMMNKKWSVYRTNIIKSFLDGIILLIIGIIFFSLNFTKKLLIGAVVIGALYAVASILYFSSLKLKDVGIVIPYSQAAQLLLIFTGSIILFNENPNNYNYLGVVLIIIGIYSVLSNKFKLPSFDKGLFLISLMVIIHIIYYLLVKYLLFDVQPLSLGITQYFAGTIILVLYLLFFKKQEFKSLLKKKTGLPTIGIAAVFGALGTFLLFTALSIGVASKVYPLAGFQLVIIFITASLFLKEKFYWHRLIGTLAIIAGIYLVAV